MVRARISFAEEHTALEMKDHAAREALVEKDEEEEEEEEGGRQGRSQRRRTKKKAADEKAKAEGEDHDVSWRQVLWSLRIFSLVKGCS